MSETRIVGCGIKLQSTHADGTRQWLPCGEVDDFGTRQFCHPCNTNGGLRAFLAQKKPRSSETSRNA